MSSARAFQLPEEIARLDAFDSLGMWAFGISVLLNAAILTLAVHGNIFARDEAIEIIPVELTRIATAPSAPHSEPAAEAAPVEAAKPDVKEEAPAPPQQERSNLVPKKKITAQKPVSPAPAQVSSPVQAQGSPSVEADAVTNPSVEAQPLEEIKPEIPDSLKTHDYKSYVRVKVDVSSNGIATTELRTSSGNTEIDNRVLTALNSWRWRPAFLDNRPVRSVRYFKFEFEVR